MLYCLRVDIMIDEKIIEGLREYLKDHYVPVHIVSTGISAAMSSLSFNEQKTKVLGCCLRDVSDEATASSRDVCLMYCLEKRHL